MGTKNDTLEMFAGTTRDLVVTVTDEDGSAHDLTGHTGEWCLARKQGDAALLTKTTGAGVVLTDPSGGICTVSLASDDTDGMQGVYYWELRLVDATTDEDVPAYGYVRILPSTTDVSG